MATVIPSKNIFGIDNQKVLKNSIKSMEVETVKTSTPDTSVYQETFFTIWINTYSDEAGIGKRYDKFLDFEVPLPNQAVVSKYWTPFATRKIKDYYIYPLEAKFKLTLTVNYGVIRSDNGDAGITLTASTVKTETVTVDLDYKEDESVQKFNFVASSPAYDALNLGFSAKVVLLNKPKNLKQPSRGLQFEIYIPSRYYYVAGSSVALTTNESVEVIAKSVDLNESQVKIVPLEETMKPQNSIEKTEFSHDTTTYNGEIASENLAKNIIANYKNGKETAVIRCSIPEDLSVFEIGDEVIPMVYGADGADRPMSRYKDGTQKVFNVVGEKFIYDGAVWQELTLQEKTQSV